MANCNYCTLKRINRDRKIKVSRDPLKDDKGKTVFAAGVRVTDKETGKFISWFAELTDHCVC